MHEQQDIAIGADAPGQVARQFVGEPLLVEAAPPGQDEMVVHVLRAEARPLDRPGLMHGRHADGRQRIAQGIVRARLGRRATVALAVRGDEQLDRPRPSVGRPHDERADRADAVGDGGDARRHAAREAERHGENRGGPPRDSKRRQGEFLCERKGRRGRAMPVRGGVVWRFALAELGRQAAANPSHGNATPALRV